VGSKVKGVELTNEQWVSHMKTELETGAWKVIAEARESGTIGIYASDGSANKALIDDIIKEISVKDVLWEAPNKAQQTMFIQLIGANVNLGNIAPGEVISLEALRCGMRGDTFFDVLPEEFHSRKL
jgi:phosphosulfolactate synthase